MEYLEQYDGYYDEESKFMTMRFEVKGTRYDGRTEQIERENEGDVILVIRDYGNEYNTNNFTFTTVKGRNVGNMPTELCNVIAPIYDERLLTIEETKVSYVEPVTKRSRHARQAVLFVEMKCSFGRKKITGTMK